MTDQPTTQQTPDELASTTPPIDQPATQQNADEHAPQPPAAEPPIDQDPPVQPPSLGRVVFYSDRQIPGSQRLAHVTGTRASIAHDEGVPLPQSDLHAHLKIMPPAGSIYDAHDVPYDLNGAPGTWRWPTRVTA